MMKRAATLALVGLWLSVFAGCGSDDSPATPTATPTPAPVTTTVLSEAVSVGAPPNPGSWTPVRRDVTVPYAGRVAVSFDWTHATSQIEMVVTKGTCSNNPISAKDGSCAAWGADRRRVKPATVTFEMPASGSIRVWVFNFSTGVKESGALSVTVTH
jgi:hypothetical protein